MTAGAIDISGVDLRGVEVGGEIPRASKIGLHLGLWLYARGNLGIWNQAKSTALFSALHGLRSVLGFELGGRGDGQTKLRFTVSIRQENSTFSGHEDERPPPRLPYPHCNAENQVGRTAHGAVLHSVSSLEEVLLAVFVFVLVFTSRSWTSARNDRTTCWL